MVALLITLVAPLLAGLLSGTVSIGMGFPPASQTPLPPGTGEVSAQEYGIEVAGRPVLISAFALLALAGLGLGASRRQQKGRRRCT